MDKWIEYTYTENPSIKEHYKITLAESILGTENYLARENRYESSEGQFSRIY